MTQAPSCNGSQQESQKLTASDTVETPSIHVDPSTGMSWVTLEDYNNLHERLDGVCEEMAKIAVIVGRSKDGTGLDVDWFELADDVKSHREAPSCNGSQQESQKLTAPSAREAPSMETPTLTTFAMKQDYNITFHQYGHGEIGRLDFNGPELVFTGNASESAKVFFDWIAKSFAGRLEEERNALRGELNAKSRELEEARKDAERYRWLREHFMHIFCGDDDTSEGNFTLHADTVPERLDAAIDSALHHDT
jgi:hypothetical protein